MKCPVDGVDLLMSERQGVEIDYCPQCRGVWLDRGELDKILERQQRESAQQPAAQLPSGAPPPQQPYGQPAYGQPPYGQPQPRAPAQHAHTYNDPYHQKKRKKSFLEEIFD